MGQYTYYLLQPDAPAMEAIVKFEALRQEPQAAMDAEKKLYNAEGYVYQNGLEALLFREDTQPEGWKLTHRLKKHFEICENTGATQRYYNLPGQSKEAKAIRARWRDVLLPSLRHFTNMVEDAPEGMFGKGFQQGMTTRYLSYEKCGDSYVLVVPIKDGDQWVPKKAKELLMSEVYNTYIKH